MFLISGLLFTFLLGSEGKGDAGAQAQALAQALTQRQMDAVAAVDPNDDRRFVAVMFYPGQLLLITGRHPLPNDMRYYLREKNYREVYSALYSAAERDGRLFVQDMGANGLPVTKDDPADVIYERGDAQTVFDRPPSGRESDPYRSKYNEIDRSYAEALRLLLAQLNATS